LTVFWGQATDITRASLLYIRIQPVKSHGGNLAALRKGSTVDYEAVSTPRYLL
jgi:hypothetical protein